ncbi:unnamed protein product [Ilex paraguariensis]|uniref:PB1-like domain-containing protein n=1 Tax=Ilex paraguariensis TaxID=185542 RepID=A0ABC8UYV4_9AQUA
MHHSGKFDGCGDKVYIGGRVNSIDMCHFDQISLIKLDNMLKNIGVGYNQITIFYQRIGNGWRALENDQHAMDLIKWVDKVKVVDVYVEHIRQELFNHSQADSNCGPSEKRFGSQNIHVSEQETNLWGPRVPTESYRSSESDASDSDSYSKGSDFEFEDLYDSEYDVYDKYLHETIVESDKGERFDKPKRKGVQIETETIQEHECGIGGEDCESDELRSLSGSSSDNDETRHHRKKVKIKQSNRMDSRHTGETLKHLEKQNELLMDAYRSMSHELHKLQVEEEILMRKFYEMMSAQGLTKKSPVLQNKKGH